jgi:hypothetical protein
LPPFKRPNFFFGKLLTAEDLTAEQNYHLQKQKLHNRYLHGWGVVSGLRVDSINGSIHISAGLALDCEGNEIIVEDSVSVDPPSADCTKKTVFVGVRYFEQQTDKIPVTVSGDLECNFTEESFEAILEDENSNRGHRHSGGRWITCGRRHAVTIGRLRKSKTGWVIDRRYRPPSAK